MNYKDYSMESRLHFRIHAALSSMGHPVEGTMQQQHVSLPAPSLWAPIGQSANEKKKKKN